MNNKPQEIKITLEDVLDVMMKEGITAGLELEKLRIKQLEQKAYDQGYIDSRF